VAVAIALDSTGGRRFRFDGHPPISVKSTDQLDK
jgi:hypothetical protein